MDGQAELTFVNQFLKVLSKAYKIISCCLGKILENLSGSWVCVISNFSSHFWSVFCVRRFNLSLSECWQLSWSVSGVQCPAAFHLWRPGQSGSAVRRREAQSIWSSTSAACQCRRQEVAAWRTGLWGSNEASRQCRKLYLSEHTCWYRYLAASAWCFISRSSVYLLTDWVKLFIQLDTLQVILGMSLIRQSLAPVLTAGAFCHWANTQISIRLYSSHGNTREFFIVQPSLYYPHCTTHVLFIYS